MNFCKSKYFLFLPFILYVLALNPYLEPAVYDNVVYLEGAESIVTEGRYAYMGKIIRDWPPMMSVCLALLYVAGFKSVLAAKIFVLVCVAFAIWLSSQVLKQNNYEFPILSFFIAVISPTLFLWGTRIVTEWPYFAISLFFLFLLDRLEKHRTSLSLIVLSGSVLAICILTRYVGITLLGAVATMIVQRLYSNTKTLKKWNLRDIYPELLVAAIGISLFVLTWVIPIYYLQQKGQVSAYYYHLYSPFHSHPLNLLKMLSDAIVKSDQWNFLPSSGFYVIIVLVNLLLVTGFIHQIINRGFKKTDGYVLCYLLLILNIEASFPRYALPIIPFLFSYFFSGVKVIGGKLPSFVSFSRLKYVLIAFLAVIYLIYDMRLILHGNGSTYGGLNVWMSPTPEAYYKNEWLDLYESAMLVRDDPKPGDIGVIGIGDTKYVRFFSQRKTYDLPPAHDASFLMIHQPLTKKAEVEEKMKQQLSQNWILLKETSSINTYRKRS